MMIRAQQTAGEAGVTPEGGVCDRCGRHGRVCDTPDGEVLMADDRVVATGTPAAEILCGSPEDGGDLLCGPCYHARREAEDRGEPERLG